MVQIIENTITSRTIISDNNNYRYQLTRIWDKSNDIVSIIMLNPSKADSIKNDKTVISLTNYLIDEGYGGMDIVNLFAFMTTSPSDLKYRKEEYEVVNDEYIRKTAEESNILIVGWGSDQKKYIRRKREVERLLIPFQHKLKCFKDNKGRCPRHPRDLNDKWSLGSYHFCFI
ncbi:DUF1643 domain-containing protein [Oceanobacillus halotolerans]|uniref:DUF1643 domain-containing protein n=1 Tax=Oceanobacillus halotolerans TaxID=2663380 RepID=UPI0013D9D926|nr:DUF1643 domain-containing protein [Oceanobacillus halotolerans]